MVERVNSRADHLAIKKIDAVQQFQCVAHQMVRTVAGASTDSTANFLYDSVVIALCHR